MNRRVWSMPFNIILFNLCYLNPLRKKNLWIYGAREGTKYDENSMYMFEYMNKHHPEIQSVWLTDSKQAFDLIRNKGYNVEYNKSVRGKLLQLYAGVALYSHGLIDFGTFPLVGGTELVALWHGMGFKKIYNGKYSGFKLKIKKTLDHLFSWTRRTMTPVTSERSRKWVKEMFTLNDKEIVITGQPRNDVFKVADKKKVQEKLGIPLDKNLIIFMPTYRMPSLGSNAMEKIVRDLYDSKDLNEALEKSNSVFLTKLHPLTPHIDIDNRANFIILDYAAVESNQELMGVCDMLVTDYSSCFVDYALLERPIIFYNPDDESFLSKSEGMDEDFFDICNMNRATTANELSEKILTPSLAAVERTNELFEDPCIKNTCYCENVYNAIIKKTRICI